MNKHLLSYSLVALLLLSSCNVKKFIPEGETLYVGSELELEGKTDVPGMKSVVSDLEDAIRPRPNSTFLGMRLGLYVYYKSQREKPGFLNKFLNKRIGEKPVYESAVNTAETEKILLNRLENRGFFMSEASSEINRQEKKKQAKAVYTLQVATPYLMEKLVLDRDSLEIYNAIEAEIDETLLKPESRFELSQLQKERERIDQKLKTKGYYNFNSEFLIFEADTNRYDTRKFDLYMRLKRETPSESVVPYTIKNIKVYPNYVIENDSIAETTENYNNKDYIQGSEFFKIHRLDPFILLKEGEHYNSETSRSTARRLSSIGAYKFVNIRYDEIDSLRTDKKGALEASIFLSPMTKRALRAELQAVSKSNNFAGPGLALTLTNRNLFGGGETFTISAKAGYEMQIASGDQTGLNSTQLGLTADLIFPRMLFPVKINTDFFKYSIPKTKVSLGADFLNRSKLYSLLGTTATFGYFWNANRFVSHEINPVSINYLNLSNTTPEFEQILEDNPFLRNSLNQQFISGITYSFVYNGLVDQTKTHQFFINTTVDLAGNMINLISGGAGEEEPNTFLGLEYSQYARFDVDLRYHLKVGGSGQKIATRLFAGIGIPYGNSEILPFAKQYFSGGPFSVRAFRIRSLGPGNYNAEDTSGTSSFFDQTGNLKLEANVEYRFPIVSFLKGAFFADAGNVWNTTDVNTVTGGKFSSNFINELGIGAGAGLRIDIQNFVIRFDLAAPLHTPYLPQGERWNFDYKNPILNFAIGYPF